MFDALLQDVRFGMRMLLKHPGFTVAVVLTLGLGIGANAAIFSLTNAMLVRPLPVEEPGRLVMLHRTRNESGIGNFSYPVFDDYRRWNTVFSGLFAQSATLTFNLRAGSSIEEIRAFVVSANYFSILGVKPVLGRGFLTEEGRTPGSHPVAVIGHTLWQQHFGSAPDVVGKTLMLNGHSFTVVGVTPEGFGGTMRGWSNDVWVPSMMQAQAMPWLGNITDAVHDQRGVRWLVLYGRLGPGITVEQAQGEMSALARRLEQAYPASNRGIGVRITPSSGYDPRVTAMLWRWSTYTMAVVGLVLLIACANVANMLVASGVSRRKEIAVRLAMGASRGRLVRQFITENLMLFAFGGGLGLVIGQLAAHAQWTLLPISAETFDARVDARVLAFTLGVSLLTAIIFGLAPAIHGSKPDLLSTLKGAPTAGRHHHTLLENILVTGQIAISLVLLIGASLFVRSLLHITRVEPGFETENVLLARPDLRRVGYDEASARLFYRQLEEQLLGIPAVRSVSLAMSRPGVGPGRLMTASPVSERRRGGSEPTGPTVFVNVLGTGYFQTMDIPLVGGRDFSDQDETANASVIIVNEAMAQRLWPGEDPVGKHLVVPPPGRLAARFRDRTGEVIGVAQNTALSLRIEEAQPFMYLPLHWYPGALVQFGQTLHIRTATAPTTLISAVREAAGELDPAVPVVDVMSVTEWLGITLEDHQRYANFAVILGLLAVVLTAVGAYSVMSRVASRRTHEIGIRMALGARSRDVLRLVIEQGMLRIAIGVALGLLAAFAATRIVASQLYGVSPTDPFSFVAVAFFLLTLGLLATYLPARQAAKTDPWAALRFE